jgi:hypothetical protein
LTSWQARTTASFLLIALGIVCIFAHRQVAHIAYYDQLNSHTADLIDETLRQDQVTFLTLSAIKASLAMIEGSTIGVGFEVQLGDLVQPVYDYIDFFWRMFLYAFMVMGAYKLLLETELLFLGIPLIGIGMVLVGIAQVIVVQKKELLRFGKRCIVFGFLFAYIAPLALLATHVLSEQYTSQLKGKHLETIESFSAQLEISKNQFIELRNQISIMRPNESIEEIKTQLVVIGTSVSESFQLSLLAFLYYILIILIDLLFFPFLSAWVVYRTTLFAIDRVIPRPPQVVQIESHEPVNA